MNKLKALIWQKKTYYMLCFVATNLIDLVRNMQMGDIWKTAANCTGFAR